MTWLKSGCSKRVTCLSLDVSGAFWIPKRGEKGDEVVPMFVITINSPYVAMSMVASVMGSTRGIPFVYGRPCAAKPQINFLEHLKKHLPLVMPILMP